MGLRRYYDNFTELLKYFLTCPFLADVPFLVRLREHLRSANVSGLGGLGGIDRTDFHSSNERSCSTD